MINRARVAVGVAVIALLIVAGVLVSRSRPAPEGPPDIVIVTFDTTRADRLGAYGYFRDTSPAFDALAAESVLFERHIVPMATTLPSHTSMFTGVYPIEHGIEANAVEGQRFIPPPGLTYITEHLAAHGYDTGAFISAAPVRDGSGMERGFASFDRPRRKGPRDADETTDAALDWLSDRSGEQPVFLWVHYFDPHPPLRAPKKYRGTWQTDSAFSTYLRDNHFFRPSQRPGSEGKVDRINNRYDEEVRFMDDHFGRLVRGLRRRWQWPNTVVVVAGDHGEGLNQHGHWGHGQTWDEQLHSPLLIRIPGVAPARVDAPVSPMDIFPTVLAHSDVPEPEAWLAQVSGRDALSADGERTLFAHSSLRRKKFGELRTFTLTTSRWKYVEKVAQDPMLFDLQSDPLELTSVAADQPAVVEDMSATLARMRTAQYARREQFGGGELVPEEAETLKALEALGYVVGAEHDGEGDHAIGDTAGEPE